MSYFNFGIEGYAFALLNMSGSGFGDVKIIYSGVDPVYEAKTTSFDSQIKQLVKQLKNCALESEVEFAGFNDFTEKFLMPNDYETNAEFEVSVKRNLEKLLLALQSEQISEGRKKEILRNLNLINVCAKGIVDQLFQLRLELHTPSTLQEFLAEWRQELFDSAAERTKETLKEEMQLSEEMWIHYRAYLLKRANQFGFNLPQSEKIQDILEVTHEISEKTITQFEQDLVSSYTRKTIIEYVTSHLKTLLSICEDQGGSTCFDTLLLFLRDFLGDNRFQPSGVYGTLIGDEDHNLFIETGLGRIRLNELFNIQEVVINGLQRKGIISSQQRYQADVDDLSGLLQQASPIGAALELNEAQIIRTVFELNDFDLSDKRIQNGAFLLELFRSPYGVGLFARLNSEIQSYILRDLSWTFLNLENKKNIVNQIREIFKYLEKTGREHHWRTFLQALFAQQTNGLYENTSALHLLACSPEGRDMLQAQLPIIIAELQKDGREDERRAFLQAICVRRTAAAGRNENISVLLILASSSEGVAISETLLPIIIDELTKIGDEDLWRAFFQAICTRRTAAAGRSENLSALYLFAYTAAGRAILQKHLPIMIAELQKDGREDERRAFLQAICVRRTAAAGVFANVSVLLILASISEGVAISETLLPIIIDELTKIGDEDLWRAFLQAFCTQMTTTVKGFENTSVLYLFAGTAAGRAILQKHLPIMIAELQKDGREDELCAFLQALNAKTGVGPNASESLSLLKLITSTEDDSGVQITEYLYWFLKDRQDLPHDLKEFVENYAPKKRKREAAATPRDQGGERRVGEEGDPSGPTDAQQQSRSAKAAREGELWFHSHGNITQPSGPGETAKPSSPNSN